MGEMQEKDKRGQEFFVVSNFILHQICMLIGAVYMNFEIWVPIVIGLAAVSTVIMFLGRYMEFETRIVYHVIMVQISITLFTICSQDIRWTSVPFVSVVVLIGLFGNARLIIFPAVSYTIIVIYHGFIARTISVYSIEDIYEYIVPILNVYFVERIVRFWIIKRNQTSQKMQQVISNLKIAERSKDDFLANVSHEIRTPINTISGMSEVILREQLPEEIRDRVLDIQTSGRNLLSTVNDLLDFSELQSGKQTLVEVEYNLTSTVNDVINMANAWKSDKNIELVVDCDLNIPKELIGDEQKIRRVLLALVNNAIKFTNDGCVVIDIGYRKEYYGINLSITVRDTGIGIDEKNQEKLFTSFSQLDPKRNRQEGGMGLGLAIVQSLVEHMGGLICVESEPGKGSSFQCVIPQKVSDPVPMISLGVNASRYNILIYINMEQFEMSEIRDEYTHMIIQMATQLNVRFHMCHNLAEYKRRQERELYTHSFISFVEYFEDREYFQRLAQKKKVIIVLDRYQEKEIQDSNLIRLYKPFYILPVVKILKGENFKETFSENYYRHSRFTAETAHVLIVDDNIINLKVVAGLLKPYKIKITTAISGAEALEKIESRLYDLVFMDHMMPEMDGIEALHRIRNKKGIYFKEIPIVALTANAVAGAREMFLSEGFQEFVSKPIELSTLERVLRSLLPEEKIVPVVEEKEELPPLELGSEKNIRQDYPEQELSKDLIKASPEAAAVQTSQPEIGLDLEDIDINAGLTYCGTIEDYIDILKLHYKDGEPNKEKIQQFYENRDWKNYTILVHGLKSSMKSVGVMKLSEMAKELEAAGKAENESFIDAHHEAMMKEYSRILGIFEKNFKEKEEAGEEEEAEKVDLSDYPELSEEELERLLVEFEDAVYTWEEDNMAEVIAELEKYQFHGIVLTDNLEQIRTKIEMSDYMSALDALKRLSEKWKKG